MQLKMESFILLWVSCQFVSFHSVVCISARLSLYPNEVCVRVCLLIVSSTDIGSSRNLVSFVLLFSFFFFVLSYC